MLELMKIITPLYAGLIATVVSLTMVGYHYFFMYISRPAIAVAVPLVSSGQFNQAFKIPVGGKFRVYAGPPKLMDWFSLPESWCYTVSLTAFNRSDAGRTTAIQLCKPSFQTAVVLSGGNYYANVIFPSSTLGRDKVLIRIEPYSHSDHGRPLGYFAGIYFWGSLIGVPALLFLWIWWFILIVRSYCFYEEKSKAKD